jgi:hypothetical protein
MNLNEKTMLSILKEGREKYSFIGVKTEFEAEGVRMEEMLRLSEITRKADLKIGIKIGGCEAITDLYQAKLIGSDYIIAPMVETSYALSKYIEAKNKIYSEEEKKDVKFFFNLETITAFNNLEEIAKVATAKDGVDGMVFGRVDFVGSLGLSRDKISDDQISKYINQTAQTCKQHDLDFIIGGAVTEETITSVLSAKKIHLTRFETRKIICDSSLLNDRNNLLKGLENAVRFELLWLENKHNYYSLISQEDNLRIAMLKNRLKTFN